MLATAPPPLQATLRPFRIHYPASIRATRVQLCRLLSKFFDVQSRSQGPKKRASKNRKATDGVGHQSVEPLGSISILQLRRDYKVLKAGRCWALGTLLLIDSTATKVASARNKSIRNLHQDRCSAKSMEPLPVPMAGVAALTGGFGIRLGTEPLFRS